MNRMYNMDMGWKFSRIEKEKGITNSHREMYLGVKAGRMGGEISKNFDDSDWQEVTLPHDYVIATEIKEENGFRDCFERGFAWYRKSFALDHSFQDKQIGLCFEGIALQAEIYLNGSLIYRTFSSYTEHFIDITDRVYIGGKVNTLVVKTNATTACSEMWTYEGGGIYRHVKLYAKNKSAHIAHNGIFAYADLLEEEKKLWQFNVQTELENASYERACCTVKACLLDKNSQVMELYSEEISLNSYENKIVKLNGEISNPTLWDVENPYLYNVVVTVSVNGEIVDEETISMGFRYYHFDSQKGFYLNGRHLKLKGVCCHQDHGGCGVAVPDEMQYQRVKLLKDMGANMYRSAHNNPAREILDACDKLGLLVIDENRRFEASVENLKHIESVTKRDRNHPSVFLYCLFNEEALQNTEEGRRIFKRLKYEVKKHDWTRLFTGAMHGNFDGAGKEMEVCGINYGYGYLDALHEKHPDVCLLGAENNSQISTRGSYKTDKEGEHVISCYDDECVPWGNTVKGNWKFIREREYMSGCSVWNGFDFHGEPIMTWPTVNSQYGLMDICGFPKGVYHVCKSCYLEEPMVKLLPHWNWEEGENIRVIISSNCEETELFVNGESLGRKASDCCEPNEWNVPFKCGAIEARGYNNGELVAVDIEKTAYTPKKVKVEVNKTSFVNDGNDTLILNCAVVDENGTEHPLAVNTLYFTAEEGLELIGVGNGDPNSHDSEVANERKLYFGKCQAIFRVKRFAEKIKVIVSGENLEPCELSFDVENTVDTTSYIETVKNNYITNFDVTASSVEWIDPKMVIDVDDMNTLLPIEIEEDSFQSDYHSGWKLYRTFISLPKTLGSKAKKRDFSLYFDDVKVNKMFVFVDGEEIYKTDITHRYTTGAINCEFSGFEDTVVELRILVHINLEAEDGAGFRKSIRII